MQVLWLNQSCSFEYRLGIRASRWDWKRFAEMSSVFRRHFASSRFRPVFSTLHDIASSQRPRFFHHSRPLFLSDDRNSSNENPPLVPQPPPALDRYLVPATVLATGAILSPGIVAMVTKPINLWFYKQYYDLRFDTDEFLVGARKALYFVAEKAFRNDFFGLKDVLTSEGMENLREHVQDESFRHYLNLRAPSTPILYERVGAAGFIVDPYRDDSQDDNVQHYDRSTEVAPSLPEQRFEILVFFVCKIEQLLTSESAKTNSEGWSLSVGQKQPGVKNYCRLLVMMTFSRLIERGKEQTSDWLVSSLSLVPFQFTFAPRE